MGNINGNIHDYWEAIDGTFGLQGGFIWDLVDQGLLKGNVNCGKYRAYGGDFGDKPNFCLNGLIWPDRTPHYMMIRIVYMFWREINGVNFNGSATSRCEFLQNCCYESSYGFHEEMKGSLSASQ